MADESVDRAVVQRLRSEGHDVVYVAELAPGIDDEEVLGRANERGAVLVTADKDFGELVFRRMQAHSGVVLLRLAGLTKEEKADAMASVMVNYGDQLPGAFTVVTPAAVRIRRLQRPKLSP